jgi:hypothetical protein
MLPSDWSRSFSDAMRTLASKTHSRHRRAMELLAEAVDIRDDRTSGVATSTDVLNAAREAARELAGMADAAYGELPEEKEASRLFGGKELNEAVEGVLEESAGQGAYEQGVFTIGTHFRKDGA